MKNRVFCLLLAVVMLVVSIPFFAVSAFAEDVATKVPNSPKSVTYIHTASKPYLADGTIEVELNLAEGQPVREIYMCWLSGGSKLRGYDDLPKYVVPEGADKVSIEMVPNTLVPEGATGLRVYTSNEKGKMFYKDIPLPETIQPLSLGEPIISFQAVSDTHVEDSKSTSSKAYTMLKDIAKTDSNSVGIFIAGDIADNGVEEQYAMMNELHSSVEGLPSMYWCMGNHDFWNGRNYEETTRNLTAEQIVELFNRSNGIEGDNTYYDLWIEGYHFILLSYEVGATRPSNEQINWLAEKLEESAEEDKPIFIFLHQPFENTVAGSVPYDGFSTYNPPASLEKILAAYPQAMLFTGHSHCDMNIPDSMLTPTDEHCYLFNCGAVIGASSNKYLDANGKKIKTSQGYYVSVYEDYVVIRGRNFGNGTWIPGAQFIVHYDGSDLHIASEEAKAEKREEIAAREQIPDVPDIPVTTEPIENPDIPEINDPIQEPDTTVEDKETNNVIIIIVASVAVVLAGVAVAFVLKKKIKTTQTRK